MIRPATADDTPQIIEMVGHFLASTRYGRLFAFVPEMIEALANRVIEAECVLVAESAGVVVGMLAGVGAVDPYSGQRFGDEVVWWVEPDARRGRSGPQLLAAFEAWASHQGLGFVRVSQPSDAPGVGEFYARRGYEPVETAWVKKTNNEAMSEGRVVESNACGQPRPHC